MPPTPLRTSTTFVKPNLARHEIADRLRRRIVAGELRPAQRVRQEELAATFGTSQAPVREALRTLAGEGLLTHETGRGYRVIGLSADDVEEIVFVRGLLETTALQAATPRIDAAALLELRRLDDAIEAAADVDSWEDGNEAFHLMLFGRAALPRLLKMIAVHWAHARRIRCLTREQVDWPVLLRPHRAELLAACLAGEVAAVIEVMNAARTVERQAILRVLAGDEAEEGSP